MEAQVDDRVAANSEELDAWSQLSFLMLDACGQHATPCGEEELASYRRRLLETKESLQAKPSVAQVLIAAGSLTQAIEEYGRQTQKRLETNSRAMRDVVGRLLEHAKGVHADLQGAAQFEQLCSSFTTLPESGFPGFQEKLDACLRTLALEHVDRHKQNENLINTLRDRLTVLEQTQGTSRAAQLALPTVSTDSCTGLPLRVDAESAIQKVMETSGDARYYVAAFYVHRMSLTNARFGEAIGNQVILFSSQHIASRLTRQGDTLFRWMGPAFVAVLERQESEMSVSSEVQRLVSTPLSRFFETSSRTVYLPMKMSAESFAVEGRTYAEVIDKLEKFILRSSQTME